MTPTRDQTRAYIKALVALHGRPAVADTARVVPITVTDWMRPPANSSHRKPSAASLALLEMKYGPPCERCGATGAVSEEGREESMLIIDTELGTTPYLLFPRPCPDCGGTGITPIEKGTDR